MKKKIIFSAGGTGGHILPAINLMKYLFDKGYEVLIVTDTRGFNYIKNNFGGEDKIRTASIIHNTPSNFKDLDYYCYEIDKSVVPCWIVFPWEEW